MSARAADRPGAAIDVIPAIDLRAGRCVRLVQGDFARETVYADDPVAQAVHWCAQGARRLHVVDLDGARDGELRNRAAIAGIVRALDVPVQVGGGIRTREAAAALFDLGVDRIVLGTAAVEDPALVDALAARHPGRIALGLDARDGRLATAGWLATAELTPIDLLRRFAALDIACAIYTDIARDGTLAGPNLPALAALAAVGRIPIVASGGIATLDDVDGVIAAGARGLIVGKALYTGELTLPALIERAAAGAIAH